MRSIPVALQAKLDAGVTMLCQCWLLTRSDGIVQGFTDHDRDIVLDGVTCRAGTGLTASEATGRFDLSVDASEISGALADQSLSEADLAAGRYDAASVVTWLVDWSEPSLRVLQAKATLGEIKREGQAFTAELRGLADALAQDNGRLFTARCGADLGDGRCQVDLTAFGLHGNGTVTALAGVSTLIVSGLESFADGFFTQGRLRWTSGANDSAAMEIKQHRNADGNVVLTLWQAMAEPIAVGDAFTVTAGCDKQFATCRDRFANAVRFRGFPHIPGNDFVVSYPNAGAPGNDGTALQG